MCSDRQRFRHYSQFHENEIDNGSTRDGQQEQLNTHSLKAKYPIMCMIYIIIIMFFHLHNLSKFSP
jgi:hypothetical protein